MYYLGFIYFTLFAIVNRNQQYNKKIVFISAIFPLLIISWLRFGVGADYFSYEYIYTFLKESSVVEVLSGQRSIEPLFKLLLYPFAYLNIPYHVASNILVSVTIVITLTWIMNTSNNFGLSVLLLYSMLFFYWNLSALRQGFVLFCSLFLFFDGEDHFSNKAKIIGSIFLSLVHITAIIVPILYLLSKINWRRKTFVLLLIISPLIRFLLNPSLINIFVGIPFLDKLVSYSNYNSFSYFSLPSLMRLTYIVFILYNYEKLMEKYSIYKDLFNFSLIGLIGYFYLPFAMVVGTRVTIFSFVPIIIIFPMILSLYKDRRMNSAIFYSLLLLSTISFFNEYTKLVDRSGFIHNKHKLNTVTIFNGSHNDFKTPYSFFMKIDEINKKTSVDSKLASRIESSYIEAEVGYTDSDTHIAVYFESNGRYGVINQYGDVVQIPRFTKEPIIFGKYLQVNEAYSSFSTLNYRMMSSDPRDTKSIGNQISYHSIKDSIYPNIVDKYEYTNSILSSKDYPIESLSNLDFLKGVTFEPILMVKEISFDYNTNFSYLRLMTRNKEYYIVMKGGDSLVNRVYDRVTPINESNIIIGYTSNTKEYINSEGEIIWYEKLD